MNELLRRILFLPEQASTVSREIDWLHYFVIIVTMAGATAVALATLYYIIRYREGAHRGGDAPPSDNATHSPGGQSIWLEAGVFAGLLALFILWWVIGFRQYVKLREPPPQSLTVYVTAKQWMWSFAYPNGSGSNGSLYVPAGQPIKLVMTSRDVIHSFYVPAFRIKQDVVPGRATVAWFEVAEPGTYPIYCTEYCGTNHSTMRGEVVALSPSDYERRVAGLGDAEVAASRYVDPMVVGESRPPAALSLAAMGQRVAADKGCFRCHTVDGTAHIGPTWAGMYGATIPLEGGGSLVANEEYMTRAMMDPGADVHLGFVPSMPSYQGFLSAAEVGALLEYIRTLRDVPRVGNDVPAPLDVGRDIPVVQPLSPELPQESPPSPTPSEGGGAQPPTEASPSSQPEGQGEATVGGEAVND